MRSSFPVFTVGAVVVGVLIVVGYLFTSKNPMAPPDPMVSELELVPAESSDPVHISDNKGAIQREEPVSQPESEPVPDTAEQEPPPAMPAYDLIMPPETLDSSDSVVRQALQAISPTLAEWLIPEEQVRKWVLAVDKLAKGELPKRYRPMEYPMGQFRVKAFGELSVMDDANYQRMNTLIATVTAIDVDLLVAYYQAWKPLLENAYSQQGEPGTFEDRLLTAIDNLLAAEFPEDKGVLIRPHVFYVYQDEALEKATDIEKLVWRMGKDNARALKAYALEFRRRIRAQE